MLIFYMRMLINQSCLGEQIRVINYISDHEIVSYIQPDITWHDKKGLNNYMFRQTKKTEPKKKARFVYELRRWQLYLMILPALVYIIIFAYKPMYGILIAFKDFSIRKGVWGSDWVGFENFTRVFSSYWFPGMRTF